MNGQTRVIPVRFGFRNLGTLWSVSEVLSNGVTLVHFGLKDSTSCYSEINIHGDTLVCQVPASGEEDTGLLSLQDPPFSEQTVCRQTLAECCL